MKRYYPRGPESMEMVEDPCGAYIRYEDHEAIIRRQAAAALAGMKAAKAISSHQVDQAYRLNRESSPEALESERSANSLLTEENERLSEEAGKYHEVMECLRGLKMEHGLCFPIERHACTHCACARKLLKLQAEYKGPRVTLA